MEIGNDIFSMAKLLAGTLSQTQEDVLSSLCKAAEPELLRRLRSDTAVEECREALVCAGAYLALSRFYAAQEDITQFEAGNLMLVRSSSAQRLADAAEQLLAPYCGGSGFAFQGVRG